jgi:hypothetical protein
MILTLPGHFNVCACGHRSLRHGRLIGMIRGLIAKTSQTLTV